VVVSEVHQRYVPRCARTREGLPLALSETLMLAVRAPVAVGLKVTLIVQLALALRLVPQVFVPAKSPLLLPEALMPVRVSVALPVLVKVTGDALTVPMAWMPKSSEAGAKAAAGCEEASRLGL